MKYRKKIDNSRFETGISEQNKLYQLVMGMRDIKLNNCETERCHEWLEIQNRLYLIEKRKQLLERLQQSGMQFFSQMSNILIGYIAACSVVERQITLGEMMSIMFVVGNLSIPIERLVEFIHKWQDAKISIDRLEEVYQYTNEKELPLVGENVIEGDIVLDAVSFSYGRSLKKALNNISLRVPSGKVVAIVGTSGSGKTTLLKLIMGYYPPSQGKISVGNLDISNIPPLLWRKQLGTVLQDGYIFSDTIAKNIVMKGEVDKKRLNEAIDISCLKTFVSSLPMGVNTIIGAEGDGLSQGQIQRILIARMIYANSNYILLDEATNSLDASNERLLLSNLRHFYKDRTVIVVAHRLSTIKKADKIIVLENGKIAEVGTHEELIRDKGKYYALVKDQLIWSS